MRFNPTFPLLLTAGLLLAAGCTTPTTAPTGPTSADGTATAPTASTLKVDRLVFAVTPPSYQTNDIRHLGTPDEWYMDPMYESLIGIDAKTGKFAGVLASEWKLDATENAIRYTLRKGVQFHKGNSELTAKDIVWRLQEKLKEEEAAARSSISGYWKQNLKEVQVVSDYEVNVLLKGPSGLAIDYSSDQLGGASVWSSQHQQKLGVPTFQTEALAGTGPYQFDQHVQGQYIRFSRVPYKHWREDVEFPAFEFRFIKESSTRLAGLLAGEVHLADIPEDLQRQALNQGMKTLQGQVPALRVFGNFMCCQFKDPKDPSQGVIDPSSPMMDVRVRKALSKAVNFNDLNRAFFGGKGEVMVNNPLHPIRPGWDKTWETRWQEEYGYDQAAARNLLTQAGYSPSNPLKINLAVRPINGVPAAEDLAETLGGYWRQVGIDVAQRQVDPTQYQAQTIGLQLFNDFALNATSANAWTGIFNYGSSLLHRSPGPEQADVDELLNRIRNTMDLEQHDGLWRQAGEKLFTAHHFLPLFWLPTTVTYNPRVVSDYTFPGSISGSWTHTYNIRAAK